MYIFLSIQSIPTSFHTIIYTHCLKYYIKSMHYIIFTISIHSCMNTDTDIMIHRLIQIHQRYMYLDACLNEQIDRNEIIHTSINLSYPSIYQFISSTYSFIHLSLSFYPSTHPFIYLFIHLYPPIHLYPSIYRTTHLSVIMYIIDKNIKQLV